MQNFRTIDLTLADADSQESSFLTPPGLGIDNVLSLLNIPERQPELEPVAARASLRFDVRSWHIADSLPRRLDVS